MIGTRPAAPARPHAVTQPSAREQHLQRYALLSACRAKPAWCSIMRCRRSASKPGPARTTRGQCLRATRSPHKALPPANNSIPAPASQFLIQQNQFHETVSQPRSYLHFPQPLGTRPLLKPRPHTPPPLTRRQVRRRCFCWLQLPHHHDLPVPAIFLPPKPQWHVHGAAFPLRFFVF